VEERFFLLPKSSRVGIVARGAQPSASKGDAGEGGVFSRVLPFDLWWKEKRFRGVGVGTVAVVVTVVVSGS